MKFFFDENISFRLASAVQSLEEDHEVVHVFDKFRRGVLDQEWIPSLADEGDWIVISGDFNITRNREIRQIWHDSNMIGYFLVKSWMHLDKYTFVGNFMKTWPKVIQSAENARAGDSFTIQQNGKIKDLK